MNLVFNEKMLNVLHGLKFNIKSEEYDDEEHDENECKIIITIPEIASDEVKDILKEISKTNSEKRDS